jgi:putative membrane protein insertion efficiency factor
MKKIVISLINTYQKIPLKSHNSCVFIPTCSQYTKESIEKHGLSKGLLHGFLRICRCHPWQKNHYDPIK